VSKVANFEKQLDRVGRCTVGAGGPELYSESLNNMNNNCMMPASLKLQNVLLGDPGQVTIRLSPVRLRPSSKFTAPQY